MNWNGLALQNEFAAEQSDTSTAGKARVLGWINDIQQDIASRCKWDFLQKQGQKILTASQNIQPLLIARPIAPTVAVAGGGSLTASSNYYVLITHYESVSKLESLAGVSSLVATTTESNKTINLTAIPVSVDPLVTERRIYLRLGTGNFYYHSSISNNTSTTASISTGTTSLIQPPDYSQIGQIIGEPNIINQSKMSYRSAQQIRNLASNLTVTGIPNMFCVMGPDEIFVYPQPSSALTCQFFYSRNPATIYASSDSIPELPIFMKEVLSAGVRMKGYFYSDRDGKVEQKNIYEALLSTLTSTRMLGARGVYRVTDVNEGSSFAI
jgi:hypothetical protein